MQLKKINTLRTDSPRFLFKTSTLICSNPFCYFKKWNNIHIESRHCAKGLTQFSLMCLMLWMFPLCSFRKSQAWVFVPESLGAQSVGGEYESLPPSLPAPPLSDRSASRCLTVTVWTFSLSAVQLLQLFRLAVLHRLRHAGHGAAPSGKSGHVAAAFRVVRLLRFSLKLPVLQCFFFVCCLVKLSFLLLFNDKNCGLRSLCSFELVIKTLYRGIYMILIPDECSCKKIKLNLPEYLCHYYRYLQSFTFTSKCFSFLFTLSVFPVFPSLELYPPFIPSFFHFIPCYLSVFVSLYHLQLFPSFYRPSLLPKGPMKAISLTKFDSYFFCV